MATAKKAVARPIKRSKAEVEREFTGVAAEVERSREQANPKAEEAAKLHDEEVRQAVEGISVDTVVQRVSALSIEVTKALAGVSEKLVEEAQRLASVREAVELERHELERLHKIDIAATSIDQLVQDYARRKDELEQEISAQRVAWEEQTRNAERERREQEEALRKQRAREADEFEYKKAQERKKAQDKYEEEQRILERKNADKQEALEKSWAAREAAIREQEAEVARLREEVAQFSSRLAADVERARDEAVRQTEARFEQQVLVLRKDAEAEKRLADLRVKTLEETIAHQAASIASLQKQLDDAKGQVQEIAVRAIEGASGSRALAHINQIAMEQAKNRSPQN